MRWISLYLTFAFLVALTGNNVLGQSEEKTFTSPKFGITIQYPADWTFVENVYEDRDYRPDDPTAYLGTACPTTSLGELLGNPTCGGMDVEMPVSLQIHTFKLKEGTTSKEFHEDKIVPRMETLKDLSGRENIETDNIQISGLEAIQTIDITGGGSMGKLLESMGQEIGSSKFINVYVSNGSTGYNIYGQVGDEKDFDTYLPTFQTIFNSIQIQGGTENSENTTFVPESVSAPSGETKSAPSEDLVLVSHKLKKGDGNYNDIIGEVKNMGSGTLEFIKIGVSVYDMNGALVGTDSTYAESSTLEPNQKSAFDIFSSKDNFEGMDSYELSLSWRTSDGIDKYVDDVQIHETGQNGSDEENGSNVGNNILENTEEAADEINKNSKKAVNKIEDTAD
jgi:hypothetical protein